MPETNPVNNKEVLKLGKKTYNRVMFMLVIFAIVVQGLQFLLQIFFNDKFGDQEWFTWALMIIPIYVIGFPLFYLLLKPVPAMYPEKHSLKLWQISLCVLINCGICGLGSIIGMGVNTVILAPFGRSANDANALMELMTNSNFFMRALVVGILAPIFEELIFRKLIIDHVLRHGEWLAIVLSGLTFGMFHGNFQQFFFATGLGMFFAYIYIRTGKIWYTIIFHMVVNLSSSVITMGIMEMLDLDVLMNASQNHISDEMLMEMFPGLVLYIAWIGILVLCFVAGLVLLILGFTMKKFHLRKIVGELPKKGRGVAAFLNLGFFFYTVIIILMFIYYYVSIIMS